MWINWHDSNFQRDILLKYVQQRQQQNLKKVKHTHHRIVGNNIFA